MQKYLKKRCILVLLSTNSWMERFERVQRVEMSSLSSRERSGVLTDSAQLAITIYIPTSQLHNTIYIPKPAPISSERTRLIFFFLFCLIYYNMFLFLSTYDHTNRTTTRPPATRSKLHWTRSLWKFSTGFSYLIFRSAHSAHFSTSFSFCSGIQITSSLSVEI